MRTWLYRLDTKGSPYLYISPFFVVFAIFGLFPLLFTVWVSLHDWSLLSDVHPFVGLRQLPRAARRQPTSGTRCSTRSRSGCSRPFRSS